MLQLGKNKLTTIVLHKNLPAILLMMLIVIVPGCSNNTAETIPSSPQHTMASEVTPSPTIVPEVTTSPTVVVTEPSEEIDPIGAKIAAMTLEEKIGQMLMVGIQGTTLDDHAIRMISEDKVGGIILYANNISSLEGMINLINNIKETNKVNPIPLFVSVDQEGGKVSRMPKEFESIPSSRAVGNTNNEHMAQTMGELIGKELKLTGFNMNYAPVLDVNSNPNNPIIGNRAFGNTADRVTQMGLAQMNGLRSEGMIPVVKHFPGHGDTSVDSHLELPVVNKTKEQLKQLEWIPFQAAIKDQAEAVMVAHILFPKLDPNKPASLSKTIIGEQLRGEMGYQGVVITDDLTMGAIVEHFDMATAAMATIEAGSDILLIAHGYDNERVVVKHILQNVVNGTLSESRIDESVYRILTLKSKYELSDASIPVPDVSPLNLDIREWREMISKGESTP